MTISFFKGPDEPATSVRAARQAMGTRVEMLLCGPDKTELRAVAEQALDEISCLDQRWSRFREGSEVSDLNRRASREPVRVNPDLLELLLRARALWELTEGAFDVSVGAYTNQRERPPGSRGRLGEPDTENGRGAGMDQIEISASRREVRFHKPGVQIDLGAIGKGYAMDRAAEVCREHGIASGLIHAGRSSILAIGTVCGRPWGIGLPTVDAAQRGWTAADVLASPHGEALLTRIELADCALGVSAPWGQDDRPNRADGGHIVDPRTGRAAQGVALAAVLAPRATDADAFATALVVGGEDLQRKLAARAQGWRSLVVHEGAVPGAFRVVNHRMTAGA